MSSGLRSINARCALRAEGEHRLIVVAGLPVHHYSAQDAVAAAYAMVFLVDAGYATQKEVAIAFDCSERTLRRHQHRYHEGGMAALATRSGWRAGRRRGPTKRLRLIERLKAQGLSNREIARRLGVTENAISKEVGPSSERGTRQQPLPFDTLRTPRKKELGFWREYTWKQACGNIKNFSLGLMSLGFLRGDVMAILGDNDPHWFWAQLAAQAAGGVITGVFSSSGAKEVKYFLEHSDAKILVAQDQEQVDKILEIKDELPLLKKVIYWDAKGLRGYDDPILASFDAVAEMGAKYGHDHPGIFEESIAKGKTSDLALLMYTSGTTGLPTATMVSYASRTNRRRRSPSCVKPWPWKSGSTAMITQTRLIRWKCWRVFSATRAKTKKRDPCCSSF